MQLTMRKFDVKKNCFTTKDLTGADDDNFILLIVDFCGFKISDFVQINTLSFCNNYKY
jgi:hypothetical protein